jgi:hypothetical protein
MNFLRASKERAIPLRNERFANHDALRRLPRTETNIELQARLEQGE